MGMDPLRRSAVPNETGESSHLPEIRSEAADVNDVAVEAFKAAQSDKAPEPVSSSWWSPRAWLPTRLGGHPTQPAPKVKVEDEAEKQGLTDYLLSYVIPDMSGADLEEENDDQAGSSSVEEIAPPQNISSNEEARSPVVESQPAVAAKEEIEADQQAEVKKEAEEGKEEPVQREGIFYRLLSPLVSPFVPTVMHFDEDEEDAPAAIHEESEEKEIPPQLEAAESSAAAQADESNAPPADVLPSVETFKADEVAQGNFIQRAWNATVSTVAGTVSWVKAPAQPHAEEDPANPVQNPESAASQADDSITPGEEIIPSNGVLKAAEVAQENLVQRAWNATVSAMTAPLTWGRASAPQPSAAEGQAIASAVAVDPLAPSEGMVKTNEAAKGIFAKAKDVAYNTFVWAADTSAGHMAARLAKGAFSAAVDYLPSTTTLAAWADTAVEWNLAPSIIALAQRLGNTTGLAVDLDKDTAARRAELKQIIGNDRMNALLDSTLPVVMDKIGKYIQENGSKKDGSNKKLQLWNSQKAFIERSMQWVFFTGAVNLFDYMDKNPIPHVDEKAVQLGLNREEKLGYYLASVLNTLSTEAEEQILKDIRDGTLELSDDPKDKKERINKLKPYFQPIADEFIRMGFGDLSLYPAHKKFALEFVAGQAAEQLAARAIPGKGTPGDNLESLDKRMILGQLQTMLNNQDVVTALDHATATVARKIGDGVEKKFVHEMLKDYPGITTYLKSMPEWKGHFGLVVQSVLLKAMIKRINERKPGVDPSLTPADTIESGMGIFLRGFDRLDKKQIKRANKIADPAERDKALCLIFKPMAQELYAMGGSEIPVPFPMVSKKIFEDKLTGEIIPLELAKFYNDWNNSSKIITDAKKSLEESIAKNHAAEGCRVIAAYIKDVVPHLIADENAALAGAILKLVHKELRDIRIDAYIDMNENSVYTIVADALTQQNLPADEASIKQYISKDKGKVRELVVRNLEKNRRQDILNTFVPSSIEVDNYINAHGDSLKVIVADNLRQLGDSTELKGMMSLVNPMIEAGLTDAAAKAFAVFKNLNDNRRDAQGNPEFLPKVTLQLLNVIAEEMKEVNRVRIQTKARAGHTVSHEEMIAGFGNKLHKAVPATPEALEARRVLIAEKKREKTLLRKLRAAMQESKKAKSNKAKARADGKIASLTARLEAAQNAIREAEGKIDPIREEGMKDTVSGYMKMCGINGPDDLKSVPEKLRPLIYPILKDTLLPKVGVEVLKKALTPMLQQQIMRAVLQMVREAENEGGLERIVYTKPTDATQAQLDEMIGVVVKQFIAAMPKSITYAAMQVDGINKMNASTLGGVIRQKLAAEGALLQLVDQAIAQGLPNLLEGSSWGTDADGKPVFKAPNNDLSFTFPKTPEEKMAEALKREQEETETEKLLKKEIAKTITGQMKRLVKMKRNQVIEFGLKNMIRFMGGDVDDALPAPGMEKVQLTHKGLWKEMQVLMDEKIEEHLGGFGKHIKRFADAICRFFVITLLGAIYKLICPLTYRGIFWVIEKYIEHRSQNVVDLMKMGILEDLYLKLADKFVEVVNQEDSTTTNALAESLMRNVTDWNEQRSALATLEFEQSGRGRAVAAARDLQRIWAEEPSHAAAFRRMAGRLRGKEGHELALVGETIALSDIPAAEAELANGFNQLEATYNAVPIAGDGHCLFRSLGFELLRLAQEKGHSGKEALYANIEAQGIAGDDLNTFKTTVDRLFTEQPQSIHDLMSKPDESDFVVRVLRKVACNYNRQQGTERLEAFVRGEQNQSAAEYLDKMEEMGDEQHSPSEGGEPELVALASAFDVEVNVLDVELIGRGQQGKRTYNTQSRDAPKPIMTLLLYKNHYDVARIKALDDAGFAAELNTWNMIEGA